MKALIAVAAYPDLQGGRALYYVHSRNLYYKKSRIDVTVLDFSAVKDYEIDGIKVITLSTFKSANETFDVLICHAPNLRNHYSFLRSYAGAFSKKLFIFHGHEVLSINKYYPRPYNFADRGAARRGLQAIYDRLKLSIWRRYFLGHIDDIRLLFVSDWLYRQFLEGTKLNEASLKGHASVISNSVGEFFVDNHYEPEQPEYDFITIRNYLDESKYGVDIVVNEARRHPEYSFLLIGKGSFFNHYERPANLTWIDTELSHEDMKRYIDSARFALLPTREDTQGLMACELVVYGIPLVTSDIEICHEVFGDCDKVAFIDNESPDLDKAIERLSSAGCGIWDKYYPEHTISCEIAYIEGYVGR